MITSYLDTIPLITNALSSVISIKDLLIFKRKRKIINIYGSFEKFIEDNDLNLIIFISKECKGFVDINLDDYYLEAKISKWQFIKKYINSFIEIWKDRVDLGFYNRIKISFKKTNYKTHVITHFCNIAIYKNSKELYDDSIKNHFKNKTIKTIELVKYTKVPKDYLKSKNYRNYKKKK